MAVHAFHPPAHRLSALVTGANRGLGLATAELLADLGYRVILTARNEAEGQARVQAIQRRHGPNRCEFVRVDMGQPADIQALLAHLRQDETLRDGVPHVVINNAGVCIKDEGNGVDASVLYRQTLAVNTWGPVALMEACLPTMQARGSGCIINVSSGDGELAYLHSVVAKRLRRADSLDDLRRYTDKVVEKQRQGAWPKGGGLAAVPWPAYAFSKAVLNTATRLAHAGLANDAARRPRVVAVCPGDVATAMCDVVTTEAFSPRQAAMDVVWAALHPRECPSGLFYRQRAVIDW